LQRSMYASFDWQASGRSLKERPQCIPGVTTS
jgi:hypothetical protein